MGGIGAVAGCAAGCALSNILARSCRALQKCLNRPHADDPRQDGYNAIEDEGHDCHEAALDRTTPGQAAPGPSSISLQPEGLQMPDEVILDVNGEGDVMLEVEGEVDTKLD